MVIMLGVLVLAGLVALVRRGTGRDAPARKARMEGPLMPSRPFEGRAGLVVMTGYAVLFAAMASW
jgi:hypothetical protein